MMPENGRALTGTGSREPRPQAVDGPSGFDPARVTNWTPGPWEVYACPIEGGQQAKDELAYQIDHTALIGSSLYLINANGKCPATTGCGPTSEANAHLIAAAPQLYEALDLLLSVIDADEVARLSIEQEVLGAACALAKARGEAA